MTEKSATAKNLLRRLADPIPFDQARTRSFEDGLASPDRIKSAVEMTTRAIVESSGTDAKRKELAEKVLADAKRVGQILAAEGPSAELDADLTLAGEAIVMSDGSRPSIAFSNDGSLAVNEAELGIWAQITKNRLGAIEATARSVGRINLDGRHVGTAFVISDDLVMTNRHVLQGIAENAGTEWLPRGEITLGFQNDGDGEAPNLIRADPVLTGSHPILTNEVIFDRLDFAVLRTKAQISRPALPIAHGDMIQQTRPVFVCGYPGKPIPGSVDFQVLMDLFDLRYGVKRYSPGEVQADIGNAGPDSKRTVFEHSCTTLGGSSGSPVFDLNDESPKVIGLHFSGWSEGNYAHAMHRLLEETELRQIIALTQNGDG